MQLVMGELNGVRLVTLLGQSLGSCKLIRAAVAYAQANNPLFEHCKKHGVRLVYYGLLDDDGAVPANLLADFLRQGPSRVECRLVNGHFHSKVIWWHGFGAYIGSANLTHAAWFNNVECGVFYEEAELAAVGLGAQLDQLFAYLHGKANPVTTELVEKLAKLADERRRLAENRKKLREKFDALFGDAQPHKGLTFVAPKGQRENIALINFVKEWTSTLQLLRGLAKEFGALAMRPTWVAKDAHPAVHFDQFLHAYYYVQIRGGGAGDEDDEGSSVERVERSHDRNKADPEAALREAAQWWASLKEAPHGEDEFIRSTAPTMQRLFARASIAKMDRETFHDAIQHVNAFRMHARQVKNVEFDLPPGYRESQAARVRRLADWLWDRRTPDGRTVRDVLDFLIWGTDPSDMAQRLWLATADDYWRLPHLGQSAFGEAVGWARPDDYPPRNNRTNKALRALGHDIKLYYSG